jgi:hypothetical protein
LLIGDKYCRIEMDGGQRHVPFLDSGVTEEEEEEEYMSDAKELNIF